MRRKHRRSCGEERGKVPILFGLARPEVQGQNEGGCRFPPEDTLSENLPSERRAFGSGASPPGTGTFGLRILGQDLQGKVMATSSKVADPYEVKERQGLESVTPSLKKTQGVPKV